MDLDAKVELVPTSSERTLDGPTTVTLFEAVRKWTNDEGGGDYTIQKEGQQMTPNQIQAVAHSQPYIDRHLAFEERR